MEIYEMQWFFYSCLVNKFENIAPEQTKTRLH